MTNSPVTRIKKTYFYGLAGVIIGLVMGLIVGWVFGLSAGRTRVRLICGQKCNIL